MNINDKFHDKIKTAKLIVSMDRKDTKMMTLATRIVIYSIFIMVCLLEGCSDQVDEEFSFVATVLENNQSNLLVEPAEGSIELSSSDKFVVHVGDDIIAIAVGDQVMIIYSGEIAESYPAQIWSFRVQLMD
ncbi:MAG: hypothetical protein U1E11_07210 [Dethiobacteria bacterium]|nr:hypothetical protein [Dethiobacteria bacterium]